MGRDDAMNALRAVSVACVFVLVGIGSVTVAAPDGKADMRVLYAGHRSSPREKDFVGFLSTHFADVKTCDLAGFADQDADGFDVVILDYEKGGLHAPKPALSKDYSKPTITIGVAGADICDSLRLKPGYL